MILYYDKNIVRTAFQIIANQVRIHTMSMIRSSEPDASISPSWLKLSVRTGQLWKRNKGIKITYIISNRNKHCLTEMFNAKLQSIMSWLMSLQKEMSLLYFSWCCPKLILKEANSVHMQFFLLFLLEKRLIRHGYYTNVWKPRKWSYMVRPFSTELVLKLHDKTHSSLENVLTQTSSSKSHRLTKASALPVAKYLCKSNRG